MALTQALTYSLFSSFGLQLRALCNICLDKLSTLSLRSFPPLKPFERRDHLADMYGRYSKSDPADVALVSPQTPLIPPNHPLLVGVCRRRHPYKTPLLSCLQWVFCVFTCNHPPQQTHHPEPPALPSSQSFREEGPLTRYARRLRSDTRPDPTEFQTIYSKIWLISRWVYIAPLVNRSKAQVLQGGAGGQSPTDGVPFTLAIS